MRFLAVALLTLTGANAKAESTASEVVARQLLDSLQTVRDISQLNLLRDLEPLEKGECFAALNIIKEPFGYYRPDGVGDGNETTLSNLARHLEPICLNGPRSKLELIGLQALVDAALFLQNAVRRRTRSISQADYKRPDKPAKKVEPKQ